MANTPYPPVGGGIYGQVATFGAAIGSTPLVPRVSTTFFDQVGAGVGAQRRQFVVELLAAMISTCALLAVPNKSLSAEDPLKSQLDKQFSDAVRRVAAVRETNRATAIVVTQVFKELTDVHSLSDFQSYVAEHYKLTRVRDIVGNLEYANLNDATLKQFDRRFFSYDRLDINFRYDADWKDIVEFIAVLRNVRL